ncbi:MAG: recombinase family protein [Clostridiales bacterium]|jgi:DNA invertase Pin-like site-specific DNA recombinase|nr:recombinase family protein [Clostridiales bacterium]
MQNAACYIRVSTDDQTEFSPGAQLRSLRDYAKKNGIAISEKNIYTDEGISGKTAKRPAFLKMIAAAKSKPKPFDVILVHKFDRFARSREDSVVYKSLLKKEAGIRVISITESIEDDKFAVILEAMLEAMAEYYSLNLAEEVKKGMTEKALRGEYQTTAPFGYRYVEKKLAIEPNEAEVVRLLYNKFAEKQNLRALAAYVNEIGIKTKRGCKFENRTIEYILNNPVYIGKTRWTPTGRTRRNFKNPESIIAQGEHEPIISPELWERVHEIIAVQKEIRPARSRSGARISTWLKGLLRCGNCGGTLVVLKNAYMQCNGYSKGSCKISHCVKTVLLEDLVLEQFEIIFQSSFEISIETKNTSNDFHFLSEHLKKIEAKERRIKEAYLEGIDTKEEYKQNRRILTAERSETLAHLNAAKTENYESFHKHFANVNALFTDDFVSLKIKNKTAHFLIKKIIFNKKEKTLEIHYK